MNCISPVYVRKIKISVDCGKCNYCLQKRRADWCFRLSYEQKNAMSAIFLTLTYDEQNIPYMGDTQTLVKEDFQKFMKRLRKCQDKQINAEAIPWPSIKYYAVGEYGEQTQRPHYHALIFNVTREIITEQLNQLWPLGLIHVGTITPASTAYVTSYIINTKTKTNERLPEFNLISKGIGAKYADRFIQYHRGKEENKNWVIHNGYKKRIPRYLRKRLFTDKEWEKLNAKTLEISDRLYIKEYERLTKFHRDPFNYMVERHRYNHDKIKDKNPKSKIKTL